MRPVRNLGEGLETFSLELKPQPSVSSKPEWVVDDFGSLFHVLGRSVCAFITPMHSIDLIKCLLPSSPPSIAFCVPDNALQPSVAVLAVESPETNSFPLFPFAPPSPSAIYNYNVQFFFFVLLPDNR